MPRAASSSDVRSTFRSRFSPGARPPATIVKRAGAVAQAARLEETAMGRAWTRTPGLDGVIAEMRTFFNAEDPVFLTVKVTTPVSQLSRNSSPSPPWMVVTIDEASACRLPPEAPTGAAQLLQSTDAVAWTVGEPPGQGVASAYRTVMLSALKTESLPSPLTALAPVRGMLPTKCPEPAGSSVR